MFKGEIDEIALDPTAIVFGVRYDHQGRICDRWLWGMGRLTFVCKIIFNSRILQKINRTLVLSRPFTYNNDCKYIYYAIIQFNLLTGPTLQWPFDSLRPEYIKNTFSSLKKKNSLVKIDLTGIRTMELPVPFSRLLSTTPSHRIGLFKSYSVFSETLSNFNLISASWH